MEQLLQKIYDFGDRAHGDQMRKYTNVRYMTHCKKVMEICRVYTQDLAVLAAALLHDVLEDTPVGKEEIHAFLQTLMSPQEADKAVQLVVELTDVYIKSAYPAWNRKKRKQAETERLSAISPDAQGIKYADIIDNTQDITAQDPDFARVFLREGWNILNAMKDGHPALRQRALDEVSVWRKKFGIG